MEEKCFRTESLEVGTGGTRGLEVRGEMELMVWQAFLNFQTRPQWVSGAVLTSSYTPGQSIV